MRIYGREHAAASRLESKMDATAVRFGANRDVLMTLLAMRRSKRGSFHDRRAEVILEVDDQEGIPGSKGIGVIDVSVRRGKFAAKPGWHGEKAR
jgi:hypothetical protein